MKVESSHVKDCRATVLVQCPRAVVRKLNDNATKGLPDTVITWNLNTTWIEFKALDPSDNIHCKPGGTRGLKRVQLMELIALERQNPGHAWCINFRKGKAGQPPRTEVYRPTALLVMQPQLHEVMPIADRWSTFDTLRQDLALHGVAWFEGHRHEVAAKLLHEYHGGY